MSNALTGDFDVVVEVAVPTVDRVLAAQHQAGTYLHSFLLRINDVPSIIRYIPPLTIPSTIASVLGSAEGVEAVPPAALHVNETERATVEDIGARDVTLEEVAVPEMGAERAAFRSPHGKGMIWPQSPFTGVHGFADIQISTPTITLPDDQSTTRVTIHSQLMVHFLSDPGSPGMPEFLHGELQATVDIDQVAWQAGNVIEVDFTKGNIEVIFQPFWADPPLSSQQGAMIEKIMHNTLRTRFQPTNALLPGDIQQIRFKTLHDAIHPAAALLLNLRRDAPMNADPSGVTQVFLGDGDDFAVAAGRDYVVSTLLKAIGFNPRVPVSIVNVSVGWWIFSISATYYIYVDAINIDLLPGQIMLSFYGHTSNSSILPDVNFSMSQAVTLTVSGNTVVLSPVGDLDLHIGGGVVGWFIDTFFKGGIMDNFRQNRDRILSQAQQPVQQALDSNKTLGAVLKGLNIPAQLSYTAIEIQPDGLLLHGTLSVPEWAPVHVESRSHLDVAPDGTVEVELTAFNSWIPGGTIQRYIWIVAGIASVEDHRFITRLPTSNVPSQWCLKVQGTRITASGPPVEENVKKTESSGQNTRCGIIKPEMGRIVGVNTLSQQLTLVLPSRPPGPGPSPELVAHIGLWGPDQVVASSTNIVVYFAGARVGVELPLLRRALFASKKKESAVVVVAVLPPGQSAAVEPIDLGANGAFALAENYKGGWGEVFEVNEVPALYLLNPQGQVLWRHVGQLRAANLTAAFDEHLVPGGRLRWQPLQLTVQQGETAPDFLFEYGPGRQLALRKLRGRPVLLNFWASWSQPSLDELRSLQNLYKASSSQESIILAINDGESPELARRIFYQELGCTFQLVTDVSRQISRLYGVNCWPTTLSLDEKGIVRDSHFGLTPREDMFADKKQSR